MKDVSDILGISPVQVRKLSDAGTIPTQPRAEKGARLFDKAAIESFLKDGYYVKVGKVSKILGCSTTKVRQLADSGELKSRRVQAGKREHREVLLSSAYTYASKTTPAPATSPAIG